MALIRFRIDQHIRARVNKLHPILYVALDQHIGARVNKLHPIIYVWLDQHIRARVNKLHPILYVALDQHIRARVNKLHPILYVALDQHIRARVNKLHPILYVALDQHIRARVNKLHPILYVALDQHIRARVNKLHPILDVALDQLVSVMLGLHRTPEVLEIDLWPKNGQSRGYSGVGWQVRMSLLCYSPDGHKLLLVTRNNSGLLATEIDKLHDCFWLATMNRQYDGVNKDNMQRQQQRLVLHLWLLRIWILI